MNNLAERNINIDIIKCFAIFFVIAVHFFLNNNFYDTVIDSTRMYIMVFMRTFFLMCVPLFLLITGFLMNKKEFSIKYYKGLKNILIPYVIISVITLIAKIILSKYGIFEPSKWYHHLNGFVDFNLIGYAWYVDLYIGLFLLIPFLNKFFSNKLQDTVLVVTLVFLTTLPTFCSSPTLVISQWQSLWAITYYIIGAYLARYDIKISLKLLCLCFIIFYLAFSTMNVFLTYNQTWNVHDVDARGAFENVILSVLFFMICLKIKFNKLSLWFKNMINSIAKLSLGIYLSSFLFDKIIYHYFNQYITVTAAKLEWFILIVPFIFICSLIMAKFVDKIHKFILKIN